MITEDDSTISAFESRQTILPRSVGFDLFSILLLDMSGSIVSSGSIPLVQNAARTFIDRVVVDQRVAIMLFDGRRELQPLVDFTDDPEELYAGIASLSEITPVDPSTNLNGAVEAALAKLDRESRLSLDKLQGGSLIVFTDGTDQASRVSDADIRDRVTEAPHTVFAVGLGEEVDAMHLGAIGKDGAEFADPEGIVAAFNRVAERLRDESQKFYVLGYCSPKRAGTHTLALAVGDHRGSLTYDFAADDFGPGCDPSVFGLNTPTTD
ncbi:MAG: VWA domain-containing protein [Myxococcota bacterium]